MPDLAFDTKKRNRFYIKIKNFVREQAESKGGGTSDAKKYMAVKKQRSL